VISQFLTLPLPSPTLPAHAAARTEFQEHAIVKPYATRHPVRKVAPWPTDQGWIHLVDRPDLCRLAAQISPPVIGTNAIAGRCCDLRSERWHLFPSSPRDRPRIPLDPKRAKRNGIVPPCHRNLQILLLGTRTITYARPCVQRCARVPPTL